MQQMQVQSNKTEGRRIKQRNRNPVPPKFHVPPKGEHCINWLPIGKRELKSRAKSLNGQRLKVIEIIINRTILSILSSFALNIDGDISFTLDKVSIINGLLTEFNNTLLSQWNGPKFRGNGWKTKKWEGKNGYYKLCKNWFDQNKCKISHTFWLPVLKQLLSFIYTLSHQQFINNIPLQNAFESCLIYACIYSICSSKIGFPKTRDLPLFLDTAIAKNTQIRKYLKQLDQNLHIYKFKEEESERYNRDKRICEAVKQRCVEYIGNTLEIKLNQFYKLINICGDIGDINLNKFTFNIRYDTKGHIGRNENSHSKTNCSPSDLKTNEINNDIMNMDDDDNTTEQSIPVSLLLSTSLSRISSGTTSGSCSPNTILPPPPISSSISSPIPLQTESMETYNMAMDNARLRAELNRLRSEYNDLPNLSYGPQHMQTRNVRQIRHNPYNPLPYNNNINNNNQFELDGMCVIPSDPYESIPPTHYNNNYNNNYNPINYENNEHILPEISTDSTHSYMSNISNNSFLSDTSSVQYNPCDRPGYRNTMMNPIVSYNRYTSCPPQQIIQSYPQYDPNVNTYQNNYYVN